MKGNKGNRTRGLQNRPIAKLTREQVIEIRRDYTGHEWCKRNAERFNCTANYIYMVAQHFTHSHIVERQQDNPNPHPPTPKRYTTWKVIF